MYQLLCVTLLWVKASRYWTYNMNVINCCKIKVIMLISTNNVSIQYRLGWKLLLILNCFLESNNSTEWVYQSTGPSPKGMEGTGSHPDSTLHVNRRVPACTISAHDERHPNIFQHHVSKNRMDWQWQTVNKLQREKGILEITLTEFAKNKKGAARGE